MIGAVPALCLRCAKTPPRLEVVTVNQKSEAGREIRFPSRTSCCREMSSGSRENAVSCIFFPKPRHSANRNVSGTSTVSGSSVSSRGPPPSQNASTTAQFSFRYPHPADTARGGLREPSRAALADAWPRCVSPGLRCERLTCSLEMARMPPFTVEHFQGCHGGVRGFSLRLSADDNLRFRSPLPDGTWRFIGAARLFPDGGWPLPDISNSQAGTSLRAGQPNPAILQLQRRPQALSTLVPPLPLSGADETVAFVSVTQRNLRQPPTFNRPLPTVSPQPLLGGRRPRRLVVLTPAALHCIFSYGPLGPP